MLRHARAIGCPTVSPPRGCLSPPQPHRRGRNRNNWRSKRLSSAIVAALHVPRPAIPLRPIRSGTTVSIAWSERFVVGCRDKAGAVLGSGDFRWLDRAGRWPRYWVTGNRLTTTGPVHRSGPSSGKYPCCIGAAGQGSISPWLNLRNRQLASTSERLNLRITDIVKLSRVMPAITKSARPISFSFFICHSIELSAVISSKGMTEV